ncbi:MAG: histidine phosphatase family protein [Chloroflexota bacterium]
MEFYFIRHGQSENNANTNNPEYIESPDPELTEKGLEQASILALYLKNRQAIANFEGWNDQNQYGFGLTHMYSSLMVRAVGTGYPAASSLGLPLTAWRDIFEEGGIYSRTDKDLQAGLPGKNRAYFENRFPQFKLPEELDGAGWWNRPFEEKNERQPRADQFFADLLKDHQDQPGRDAHRVAIFSHGGFFMRLMCTMLAIPWRKAGRDLSSWFFLNNASISRFDISNGELTVRYINRTDHLPPSLIT